MAKKISKKWLLLLVPLLILPMIITDSGFCYSEKRWPSKLEIVDRALFDQQFRKKPITLTREEKIKLSEEQYSSRYPEFCKVNSVPFDLNGWENLLNLISGRKFYEVECVYPRPESDQQKYPTERFYWKFSSVDACAAKVVDTTGSSATEREYESFLNKNQNYWQENE